MLLQFSVSNFRSFKDEQFITMIPAKIKGHEENIAHVAPLRQARRTYEPDPVWAAVEAHLGGADGITVHLREDRRHIQDHDVRRLRELTHIKLNLEMAATDEMVGIACALKPEMAMLALLAR